MQRLFLRSLTGKNNNLKVIDNLYKEKSCLKQTAGYLCFKRESQMKLSVSGLPKDLFEADVEELFAPYGRVNFVTVYFDSISMKNRGKAMVEMRDPVEAERALQALNGRVIGQNTLKIKVEQQAPFSAPPQRRNDGGFDRNRGQQNNNRGDEFPRMRRRMPLRRND